MLVRILKNNKSKRPSQTDALMLLTISIFFSEFLMVTLSESITGGGVAKAEKHDVDIVLVVVDVAMLPPP